MTVRKLYVVELNKDFQLLLLDNLA